MRDSERLLEQARRCFEQAAACRDAAEMHVFCDLGRQYLAEAEAAAARETTGNGSKN